MSKVVAEFKRVSPGKILYDLELEDVVDAYDEDPDVWGISIVADGRWLGSYKDIWATKQRTSKPILAKGLDLDPRTTAQFGADYFLTYMPEVAIRELDSAWLEVFSIRELKRAFDSGWPRVLVGNNRDTQTGELEPGNAEAIRRHLPPEVLFAAASGYEPEPGVGGDADFVIIGDAFLRRMAA